MRILVIAGILCSVFALSPWAKAEEFRGMWVITWEIFQKKDGTTLRGDLLRSRIREILDNVKAAGLNSVIWQVRQGGTAYYLSPFEPWGKYLNRTSPGFDPLEYAIQEAHSRGLTLHAWVNTFEAFDSQPGTPAFEHPEWVTRDAADKAMPGRFSLSPGLAAVRDYLREVLTDLVRRYDIDGLHLDYVRWGEIRWSDFQGTAGFGDFLFDSEHPEKLGVPAGFATWDDWRRDGVTSLVSEVSAVIHREKPDIVFSVAALGRYNWGKWNGYLAVFQDAAYWLNQGFVDQIMAMNYEWRTSERMYAGLTGGCPECWEIHLGKAIQEGRCYSAGIGSQMLRMDGQWRKHLELVQAIRRVPWVCGMQFFSYGDWEKTNYFAAAKEELFTDK